MSSSELMVKMFQFEIRRRESFVNSSSVCTTLITTPFNLEDPHVPFNYGRSWNSLSRVVN